MKSLTEKLLDLQIALLQFRMLQKDEKVILVSRLCDIDIGVIESIATEIVNQASTTGHQPTPLGIHQSV